MVVAAVMQPTLRVLAEPEELVERVARRRPTSM